MAYLGTKEGALRLAKQLRVQAKVNRDNAELLKNDPDLPNESSRLLAEADELEREAALNELAVS